jgi:hypothetical protein
LEQLTPLILVSWIAIYTPTRESFVRTLRHPIVVAFAVFIAWNIFSTLLFSPSLGKSASILAWLTIDLLLLAGLLSLGERCRWAEDIGIRFVVPWALAGFAVFVIANQSKGGFTWGTDFDWLYQVYVSRVTAIEANIYGSILVLWTLLLVARKGRRRSWMIAAAVSVPLGLIASQTRTALICIILGLVVHLGYETVRWAKSRQGDKSFWFGPIVLIIGVLLAYGASTVLPEYGDPSATPSTANPKQPERQDKLGDVDFQGGTMGFRVTVAQLAAEDMHGVNLWLGNGTNTFGLRHEQPDSPGVAGHIIMLPVQILYDVGIVGLLLLGGFGVIVLRYVPWERRPVAYAVSIAFLTATALTSMFWFSITWIVVASLVRPLTAEEKSPESTRRYV